MPPRRCVRPWRGHSEGMTAAITTALLSSWGETLTCYTAALGSWLGLGGTQWWRPLASGGPHIAVQPEPGPDGDLFSFEHHPRRLCPVLGLTLRTAAEWDQARPAILAELDGAGRVIMAGDTWALRWHPAWGKAHAPHWFVLTGGQHNALFAEDPLSLVTEWGPQTAARIQVAEGELSTLCAALPAGSQIYALRERAVLGVADPGLGAAYRWLKHDPAATVLPERPAGWHRAGAALRALASQLAERSGEAAAYEQADDVWQALRQREFTLAALNQERRLGTDVPDPARWQEALELWRTLPPLFLHARMLAKAGCTGRSALAIPETLHRIADAEEGCADAMFPELPW